MTIRPLYHFSHDYQSSSGWWYYSSYWSTQRHPVHDHNTTMKMLQRRSRYHNEDPHDKYWHKDYTLDVTQCLCGAIQSQTIESYTNIGKCTCTIRIPLWNCTMLRWLAPPWFSSMYTSQYVSTIRTWCTCSLVQWQNWTLVTTQVTTFTNECFYLVHHWHRVYVYRHA